MKKTAALFILMISVFFLANCKSHNTPDSSISQAEGESFTLQDTSAFFSHYVPAYGGTNVHGDPNTTGSGEKVSKWYYGGPDHKCNGVACPPALGFGSRIRLGQHGEFTCIDRGCWIVNEVRKGVNGLWFDVLKTKSPGLESHGAPVKDWEVLEYIPSSEEHFGNWNGLCKQWSKYKPPQVKGLKLPTVEASDNYKKNWQNCSTVNPDPSTRAPVRPPQPEPIEPGDPYNLRDFPDISYVCGDNAGQNKCMMQDLVLADCKNSKWFKCNCSEDESGTGKCKDKAQEITLEADVRIDIPNAEDPITFENYCEYCPNESPFKACDSLSENTALKNHCLDSKLSLNALLVCKATKVEWIVCEKSRLCSPNPVADDMCLGERFECNLCPRP